MTSCSPHPRRQNDPPSTSIRGIPAFSCPERRRNGVRRRSFHAATCSRHPRALGGVAPGTSAKGRRGQSASTASSRRSPRSTRGGPAATKGARAHQSSHAVSALWTSQHGRCAHAGPRMGSPLALGSTGVVTSSLTTSTRSEPRTTSRPVFLAQHSRRCDAGFPRPLQEPRHALAPSSTRSAPRHRSSSLMVAPLMAQEPRTPLGLLVEHASSHSSLDPRAVQNPCEELMPIHESGDLRANERLAHRTRSLRLLGELEEARPANSLRTSGHLQLDPRDPEPVPGSGDPSARLLLVRLAPSLRGTNARGRMFTGDASAATLTRALFALGLASAPTSIADDDGLELRDVRLTAAARCAPPRTGPRQPS